MKLSTKSRYAARLMVRLAMCEGDEPLQLNEISKQEEISEKYLSQIVIPLRRKGLIDSVRGARGGYRLSRKPTEISLLDVVDAMENGIEIVHCLKNDKLCSRSSVCSTYMVWDDVSRAMEETLSRYTLDVILSKVGNSSNPLDLL
ncbi:MAG: Rrf2 family transcriptional regulator [Spirochaetales bacterium]|nr:Rrf2 family transcriptional regulator [Spirochaetales bacterium]